MPPKSLSLDFWASPQLSEEDVLEAASSGFKTIINARPDGEDEGQPASAELESVARRSGLHYVHIPIFPSQFDDASVRAMAAELHDAPKPILGFCRSGTRAASLWALALVGHASTDSILKSAAEAGYDLSGLRTRMSASAVTATEGAKDAPEVERHVVVIVGGGSGGIAAAASLLKRNPKLDIAVIEPATHHYYQPGWTMVGGGIFDPKSTCRTEASVIPKGVHWVRSAVKSFRPDYDEIILEDGRAIGYKVLVVAPGIELDWAAIPGLGETLGRNGVTSNYSFETAPYTWELVQGLKEGVALFTQPPMPIKCAGAPQKAMYLSCDHWKRQGFLPNIDVVFHNAGSQLFGVVDYVPALLGYIARYDIDLELESKLVAVDGPARQATFSTKAGEVTQRFDMLHVCPPQKAPAFVRESQLANPAGYVEVDETTLRHARYPNVFALGDGASTSNAKTAAAARQQAPVIAVNVLDMLAGREPGAGYNGYGSCPLTVERGKIVLAEFGYGGKLMPTFPKWMMDGTKAQRLSWWLKSEALPLIYWNGMLKGREWLASPKSPDSLKTVV